MVDIKDKCNQCEHHATCKYCQQYEKKSTEIQERYKESIPLNILVSCRHFLRIQNCIDKFAN